MTNTTTSLDLDDVVFLLGRPPIGEFLGFVRASQSSADESFDLGTLTREWRAANDRVLELEQSEAGFADGPSIQPLPDDVRLLADQVVSDPMFARAYGQLPVQIGMVELDRLVVFQKHVNLGFVEETKALLGPKPDDLAVARLAFGIDRPLPPAKRLQNANNGFTFVSPSNDLRFLEATLLPPELVGHVSGGRPSAYLVLAVGFGSNLLNAIHVNGRLILNNGSHRAYALRDLGITHAPCVIQAVSRPEELELIGNQELSKNQERYLRAPRPSVLRDYFDPSLRKLLRVPRQNRLVRVQFGIDVSDVPAA